jgi:hypothetical protein
VKIPSPGTRYILYISFYAFSETASEKVAPSGQQARSLCVSAE